MSGGMVKVTELLGGYQFGTQVYGPFRASKETPFLEVPAALAAALNLPLHPDEVKAREDAQAEREQDGEGISVDEILKANQDLKADFDRVQAIRDELLDQNKALRNELDSVRQELRDHLTNSGQAVVQLQAERDGLLKRVQDAESEKGELHNEIRKLMAENESLRQTNQDFADRAIATETPAEPAQEQRQEGTPLVEGLPHADLLTTNDFGTMEKLAAGLVVAEGETESPVQKIDGVGKKTLEAYAKAVAEWKAGKGN